MIRDTRPGWVAFELPTEPDGQNCWRGRKPIFVAAFVKLEPVKLRPRPVKNLFAAE